MKNDFDLSKLRSWEYPCVDQLDQDVLRNSVIQSIAETKNLGLPSSFSNEDIVYLSSIPGIK